MASWEQEHTSIHPQPQRISYKNWCASHISFELGNFSKQVLNSETILSVLSWQMHRDRSKGSTNLYKQKQSWLSNVKLQAGDLSTK